MKVILKNQNHLSFADFGKTQIGYYLTIYLDNNVDFDLCLGSDDNGLGEFNSREFFFEGVGIQEGVVLGVIKLQAENLKDNEILNCRILEHQSKNEIRFYFVEPVQLEECSMDFKPSSQFIRKYGKGTR